MGNQSWLLAVSVIGLTAGFFNVEELHSWRYLTYMGRESSNPEKAFLTGMQLWRDKIFINIPRLYDNIPITFGWIPRNEDKPTFDQPIRPFPNYFWQDGEGNGQCRGFISTFRSRIDRCDRIWTIDSGKINALGSTPVLNPRIPCPARLLAFDLVTGQHVRTAAFPDEVVTVNSTITYVSVDFVPGGGCDDFFVYISDTLGGGLIVYDVRRNSFWRHNHKSFEGDPSFQSTFINGQVLTMEDGLIGSTTATYLGERVLIYHPYSSLTLYYVPLKFVNNPSVKELPVKVLMRQNSQGIPLTTDAQNNLLFSPLSEMAIYKWNPNFEQPPQLLAMDAERMQVLSDFDFDGEQLWFSSNRLQAFLSNNYFNDSTNLRIMRLQKNEIMSRFFSFNDKK